MKKELLEEIKVQKQSLFMFKKLNIKDVSITYVEECLNDFAKIVLKNVPNRILNSRIIERIKELKIRKQELNLKYQKQFSYSKQMLVLSEISSLVKAISELERLVK